MTTGDTNFISLLLYLLFSHLAEAFIQSDYSECLDIVVICEGGDSDVIIRLHDVVCQIHFHLIGSAGVLHGPP